MPYHEQFRVVPGSNVRLADSDPTFCGIHEKKKSARRTTAELQGRMATLQSQLFAENKRSLLICLQGLDASGKDGVIRHVIGSMNPQGCRVVSFKEPSREELAHDFLWRVEQQTPRRGEVAIFNRSHYEDVLIVRVHQQIAKEMCTERLQIINTFERGLVANGTQILKFFLNISKDEQLHRFEQRLTDPTRQWKIAESDYSERDLWDKYQHAYDDALAACSTAAAPWYVIPADHKWFRNLVISQIVVRKLEEMKLQVPEPQVDLGEIRKKYHQAVKGGDEG